MSLNSVRHHIVNSYQNPFYTSICQLELVVLNAKDLFDMRINDSLCCTIETNTMFYINYSAIKFFKIDKQ